MAFRKLEDVSSRLAAICLDIRTPSFMAFRRPPPSPRNAGPRHSGRRIKSRTTRLAFSSTFSPTISSEFHFAMYIFNEMYKQWITKRNNVQVKISQKLKIQNQDQEQSRSTKMETLIATTFLFVIQSAMGTLLYKTDTDDYSSSTYH